MSKIEKYNSYKDSGVEWLGKIPSEWEVKKLKFLAKDILGGGTPNSSTTDYWTNNINNSYLWVSIADITNSEFIQNTKKYITNKGLKNCSAKIVPPYSILYSIYASLGKVAYSDKEITTNQAILSIIFQEKYYYKFMFYYLKTLTQVAIHLSNSTTQDNISLEILKNLNCSIPPKQEQQKIALFLDTKTQQLDKAIKQKEKLINLLKERRQIIINNAVTKGLDKTVTMKDSGVEWIGEIPEGWEITKLGAISEIKSNKNHPEYEVLSVYRDYGVVIKSSRDDNHNATSLDTSTYKAVDVGDLVVNKMKAWQGSMGISPHQGIVSPAYITCRIKPNIVNNNYLHTLIRTHLYIGEYNRISYGIRIGQWDMRYEDFKQILILIPPRQEQQQIIAFIENQTQKIDKAIDLQQKQITKLKEYKTTLIDSVVTGKVRVYDE
jgi:type I restriction enzyme S subunit